MIAASIREMRETGGLHVWRDLLLFSEERRGGGGALLAPSLERLYDPLRPCGPALQAMGLSPEDALRENTSLFSHGVGLLQPHPRRSVFPAKMPHYGLSPDRRVGRSPPHDPPNP